MANVIGSGKGRFLTDETGDPIDGTNRLPVETEQDDAFSSWVSYQAFEVRTDSSDLTHADHTGQSITSAKEILIQTDDANTSYIMVGSDTSTTVADATKTNRKGIKLNGGETLVLAISTFASIHLDAETSGQIVYVSYFA